jgi:hypothetical protein
MARVVNGEQQAGGTEASNLRYTYIYWKYALEPTGFDPLVDSDGFDPLWCKSPNGPQML